MYFGKRKGSASTADLGPAAVRETVEKACAIARYTAEDPYAGLVEPEALARDIPDLDLDHPWELAPERAIELARDCEAAGLAVDARLTNSEGAAVSSQRHPACTATRSAFSPASPAPATRSAVRCSRSRARTCSATTGTASRAMPASSATPQRIGRTAGQRALARLGARRLTTRKAPVAFTPDMARGLFRHFIGAISGTSQYRKSSFLLNAAGEQVFPAFLQTAGAAAHPEGARQQPRSTRRAPRRTTASWCSAGVLGGYVLGSYSARRLGLKTTGNAGGVHNLIVTQPPRRARPPRRSSRAWTPGCW